MLAPLTASASFCMVSTYKLTLLNELDVSEMATIISLSASLAALIFFGWGFDA